MSKRRKKPLGPFAGVDRLPSQGLPNDTLGLLGTKLTLHEDALGTISSAVENNLLHLGNDENNAVDRFDVRLLLDDISGVTSIRPSSARAVPDCELEEELDEERYADLAHAQEVDTAASPTASADATLEHGTSYQAVGLSYGEDSAAPENSAAAHFDPGFDVLSEHQHAMRDMTDQQHKVMMQTARFVRQEGDQLELVLRIRQGHNASFTFLRPDSPLYDYYRWLVHAQPQAREADAPEASPAAAAVEEQREEPSSGALSHLISMYGASQDEADSTSPNGRTDELEAPDSGSGHGMTVPDGQGAGDHPVLEGPLQPKQAPPAPSSAVLEHDGRVDAEVEGDEVAEQAAQQAQRAEQPPPEVQGIVAKLLAFVKKSGVKFEASIRKREASNPRFGFLLPGHPFHSYYREQITAVLGSEKANELLATLPAATDCTPLNEDLSAPSAACAAKAPRPQPSGKAVQVTIRSNPSLAKIAFARRQNPLAKAASTGNAEDGQAPDQASVASPEEILVAAVGDAQANTDDRQDPGERSIDGGSSDSRESTDDTRNRDASPGLSDVLMEGDVEQHAQRASAELAKAFDKGQGLEAALQAAAEADARKADEALKAERRRLAMQLLASRRSEAETARREERSAPTAQAIARHRLALLAEESDSQDRDPEAEEAEAGEITPAKIDSVQPGAKVRTVSLPKLEEVIRPPPLKQETSSESSSSSSRGNDDRSHSKRGGRRGQRSPDSGHRSGSPGRQRERKRGTARSSERGTEKTHRRSAPHSADEDSNSDRDGRRKRKSSSQKERRHAKRSREGTDSHERHKQKRPKHRKEASSKGKERHRSRSKGLDEPRSRKSAAKHKQKSEKRHDWGNIRTESQQKVASPRQEHRGPTVSVSEVPDDLRARIKAMLARS